MKKLFGYSRLTTNVGCSYAERQSPATSFERSDVKLFGKNMWHGSNVIWFWVTLNNGTMLQVVGTEQSKDNAKWLAKLSKKLGYIGSPDRHCPEVWGWIDAVTGEKA